MFSVIRNKRATSFVSEAAYVFFLIITAPAQIGLHHNDNNGTPVMSTMVRNIAALIFSFIGMTSVLYLRDEGSLSSPIVMILAYTLFSLLPIIATILAAMLILAVIILSVGLATCWRPARKIEG